MRHSPARIVASQRCSVLAPVPENEARDFSFTNINISTPITRARRALRHRLPRRPRIMSAASGSDASSNRSLDAAAGQQLLHALQQTGQRAKEQAQTIAQQAQIIAQQAQTSLQQAQTTLQQAQTTLQQAQTIAQQAQTIAQQAQTIAQQAQTIVQLRAAEQQQAQTIMQLRRDIEALQAAQQAPRRRGLLRLFSCC